MATPSIDEIEHLVRSGKHAKAKTAIANLKKTGLNSGIRIRCSDWYLRIGLPNEAIKILGSELLESELKFADVDTLKLQARLAYMLGYFGADRSAERVAKKLKPYLAKDRDLAAQYYRYQGGNYMRVDNYVMAAESYRLSLEYLDSEKDLYLSQMMRLGYADGLEGSGHAQQAVKIATQVLESAKEDQVILKAIAHQARGEYYFKANKLQEAKNDFTKSWQLFPKDISSRDYGFLAKWSGALELSLGNKVEAKKHLELSLKILSNDRLRPTNVLEVLFWLAQLDPKRLTHHYWVLNTHPSQIAYSYLTGRRCGSREGLHPWILDRLKKVDPPSGDTWLLKNGSLKSTDYSKVVKKSENGTLDLVSGILYKKGRYQTLTSLKTKCLLALASAAHLGLSDWSLIDYIYDEEWQVPQSMVIRLNDLIKQLRLGGFKIIRKKNQFFWFPNPKLSIIMPMDHIVREVIHHLRHLKQSFTRQDIEKLYGVKPPAAKLWIKQWIEDKVLITKGAGRNTHYHF